jgi:hypothetical protein
MAIEPKIYRVGACGDRGARSRYGYGLAASGKWLRRGWAAENTREAIFDAMMQETYRRPMVAWCRYSGGG